ncbi:CAIB/BAIF CoA-transferase, family III family protein [Bordetella bronchiseptica D993]|nr:CAIB/BAIF CoA-transferase, family III family protein [Bordetella bronchiseptica D993]
MLSALLLAGCGAGRMAAPPALFDLGADVAATPALPARQPIVLAFEAVPMFETLVSFALAEHMSGHTFEPPRGPMGYSRVLSPQRRPYRTRDGYLALLPYTDAQWQRFFALAQRADLAADPRYVDAAARARHFDALYQDLADIVAQRGTQQWLDLLADADIPHSRVNTPEGLFDDPHLRATGFFQQVDHPTEGALVTTAIPVRFSRTPGSVRRLAPRQDADRDMLDAGR